VNSHPLVQFPADLPTPASLSGQTDEAGEAPQLLELRTESGTFYVSPSRWQRLRLRWLFRHFHELPQQVLSRRDQRLIEKLSQLQAVAPPPPDSESILGVIERPRSRSTASAHRVVTMTPRDSQTISHREPPQEIFPEKPDLSYGRLAVAPRSSRRISDAPFRQWGALGWLAAVCILMIGAKLYFAPAAWRGAGQAAHASAPVAAEVRPMPRKLATPANPAALQPTQPPVPLLAYVRPMHWLAPEGPASSAAPKVATPAPSITESTSAALPTKSVAMIPSHAKPVFVSELPQGHFAAPVLSDRNRVGELQLKAMIAPDGSVQDVSLVSGDPKLAEAGMRAVRRWHYNPYPPSESTGERETFINMKFFGQDAVSVTSTAR
jgi:hypothetical protein